MRSMTLASSALATAVACAFTALALTAGCGSSSSSPTSGSGAGGGSGSTDVASLTYNVAAAVAGSVDDHCVGDAGTIVQPVSAAACHPDAGASTGDQGVSDYGLTMYGSSGSDDDCKYHVKWESTALGEGTDTYFRVTATVASTMDTPLTGATPILEVYLSSTHPAPNTNQTPSEISPGVYIVGPIQFDAPGEWTVRFHFSESCSDVSPDSPHGHAAFYVDVP